MRKAAVKRKAPEQEQELYISYEPLGEVQKWPRNAKEHDLVNLDASFGRFGQVAPPLIDERTGKLVAGHGRVDTLAQRKRDGKDPPRRIKVRESDGEWLIPIVRGIAFKNDREAEAYLVADNRHVELGGWNDQLQAILRDLAAADATEGIGYTEDQLADILYPGDPEKSEREPVIDDGFVNFKFGDIGGRVSRKVYNSFVERYEKGRDGDTVLLDDVLKSWLKLR